MAQWSKEQVEAGQAVYTPKTFAVYDLFVHGLSNQAVWRCPTRRLQALYDRNVAARHLDVGVGTGYFLDKSRWPVKCPAITLVDLNEHSLKAAADRIERFGPNSVRANVLEPLHDIGRFDSVGLCYLLHCLPGTLMEKMVVFDNLGSAINEGAIVFGATILQGDAPRTWVAQKLMNRYNQEGVFCNTADKYEDLEDGLAARFEEVRIERHGAVALFQARAVC